MIPFYHIGRLKWSLEGEDDNVNVWWYSIIKILMNAGHFSVTLLIIYHRSINLAYKQYNLHIHALLSSSKIIYLLRLQTWNKIGFHHKSLHDINICPRYKYQVIIPKENAWKTSNMPNQTSLFSNINEPEFKCQDVCTCNVCNHIWENTFFIVIVYLNGFRGPAAVND